jgi:hypothetical protein
VFGDPFGKSVVESTIDTVQCSVTSVRCWPSRETAVYWIVRWKVGFHLQRSSKTPELRTRRLQTCALLIWRARRGTANFPCLQERTCAVTDVYGCLEYSSAGGKFRQTCIGLLSPKATSRERTSLNCIDLYGAYPTNVARLIYPMRLRLKTHRHDLKLKLRPTVSRPMRLGVGLPSGTCDQIFLFCLTIFGFFMLSTLSVERTGL